MEGLLVLPLKKSQPSPVKASAGEFLNNYYSSGAIVAEQFTEDIREWERLRQACLSQDWNEATHQSYIKYVEKFGCAGG